MLDILITGGRILDGSGNPPFAGHIGIDRGRIALIGRGEPRAEARKTLDVRGLVVAPGFIDVHTHSDYSILAHNAGCSTLFAGVTTEATGVCGYGVFPVNESRKAEITNRMAGISQVDAAEIGEVDWTDLDGWLNKLEKRGIGYNLAHFCGHGAIRAQVMGDEGQGGERVHPTPGEMDAMKEALASAMQQGAFGLATGLMYAPGRNATTREVTELARVAAQYGGSHASHMRSEGEFLIWAAGEFIDIARGSGIRATINHHKGLGMENWGKVNQTLRMLERARDEGLDVMCDFYPWEYAAQSNLGSAFYTDFELTPRSYEALAESLTDDDQWEKLKTSLVEKMQEQTEAQRKRIKHLAGEGIRAALSKPMENLYIVHSPGHPELEGLSVLEAHGELGRFDHYFDTLRWLYLEDDGLTQTAGGTMSEDDLITTLRDRHSAISTDGWTFSRQQDRRRPGAISLHPRNYGTYAQVLGRYTREKKIIPLEEAVRKMTSLPAALLGLNDRGMLKPGLFADITIFDPETVGNRADHSQPDVYPEGIRHVLVNGELAIEEGEWTGSLAGRALRSGR